MRARTVIAVVIALSVAVTAWGVCHVYRVSRAALLYQQSRGPSGIDLGEQERAFDLGAATRIIVDNEVGDVRVVTGGPRVTLRAHSYALDGSDLARRGMPTITGAVTGDDLKITAHAPRGSRTRTDLLLAAPPGAALLIRSRVGSVTAGGRSGSVTVESGSGEVQIAGCAGPVSVRSSAGSVGMDHVRGAVAVELGVGEIVLSEMSGPLEAHSHAGSITIAGATSDEIAASVGCGEVVVEMAKPFFGQLKAHAGTGSVAVALKPGSRSLVDARVGLGDISDGLPTRVIERRAPGLIEVGTRLGEVTLTEAM